jgi:branched-chain amino acid transport system substrate-binding protein
MKIKHIALACLAATGFSLSAWADINVGVTLSATGPAASLGIPEKNTVALLPKTMGGQKVNYIVLDDASDDRRRHQRAQADVREGRHHLRLVHHAGLAGHDRRRGRGQDADDLAGRLGGHHRAAGRWVFKTPQNDIMMALAIAGHMADHGIKTVGFIGADAYGEGWYKETVKALDLKKIKLVANERYSRTDTAVTGQVLKLMAAKPDAILIAGSARRRRCPRRRSRSVATARSTRPTAWPTTTSCASAARTWTAPAARRPGAGGRAAAGQQPGAQVGAGIHPRLRGRLRQGACPPSAATPGTLARCWPRPCRRRSRARAAGHRGLPLALRDALEQVKDVAGAHGIQHVGARPPGAGPARRGDGQDRERQVGLSAEQNGRRRP